MEVEYKKDLRHNYMIITENENERIEPYCIKILEYQSIDGLLTVEQRRIDNKVLFYYDITAKQSMINLLDKTVLSYERIELFFMKIISTIEKAYENLLPEDDFILKPEYIYLDVITNSPDLCFLSGYRKSIKEQMNSLIEYLMNKVDYNDKEAVLLVYQLYAVSKEDGFTFDHLLEVLHKQTYTQTSPSGIVNLKSKTPFEQVWEGNQYKVEERYKEEGNYEEEGKYLESGHLKEGNKEKGRKLHKDQYKDQHKDQYKEKYKEQHKEKYIEKHKDQYIEQHKDQYIEQHKEQHKDQYKEQCKEQHKAQSKEENQRELQQEQQKEQHKEQQRIHQKERGIFFRDTLSENQGKIESNMSVMMERLEDEEEISCYPLTTYYYTIACIIGGILVVVFSFTTRVLYNSFGNRVDFSKLFALFLIVFCIEGYLLKKIWDKANKITKLVTKQEYVDPRQEYTNPRQEYANPRQEYANLRQEYANPRQEYANLRQEHTNPRQEYANPTQEYTNPRKEYTNPRQEYANPRQEYTNPRKEYTNPRKEYANPRQVYENQGMRPMPGEHEMAITLEVRTDYAEATGISAVEEEYNPTCLLNDVVKSSILVLNPRDEVNYKTIRITEFPFFIGKLKRNVDYCLEKDVVSRFHAKITKEQEQFYITDLNSTNGTFVNQEALQTYQRVKINIGDEIAFANIKYLLQQEIK